MSSYCQRIVEFNPFTVCCNKSKSKYCSRRLGWATLWWEHSTRNPNNSSSTSGRGGGQLNSSSFLASAKVRTSLWRVTRGHPTSVEFPPLAQGTPPVAVVTWTLRRNFCCQSSHPLIIHPRPPLLLIHLLHIPVLNGHQMQQRVHAPPGGVFINLITLNRQTWQESSGLKKIVPIKPHSRHTAVCLSVTRSHASCSPNSRNKLLASSQRRLPQVQGWGTFPLITAT